MNISDAPLISMQETLDPECNQDYVHVVHAVIWSPWDAIVVKRCKPVAAVLMQMRFDGSFGFVGGIVDKRPEKPQDIIDALHKECKEELNLNLEKFRLTLEDIHEIEMNCCTAQHYMDEVLGNVRIPLYTMDSSGRGFPLFLNNMFIGNAKTQLLYALKSLEILQETEISEALALAKTLTINRRNQLLPNFPRYSQ